MEIVKIVSPKIKNYVEYSIIDSMNDNDFSNKLYNTNIKENITISDITFDSCIFNNINLSPKTKITSPISILTLLGTIKSLTNTLVSLSLFVSMYPVSGVSCFKAS